MKTSNWSALFSGIALLALILLPFLVLDDWKNEGMEVWPLVVSVLWVIAILCAAIWQGNHEKDVEEWWQSRDDWLSMKITLLEQELEREKKR